MFTIAMLAGAVIVGGCVAYAFWDDLLSFMKQCVEELKNAVRGIFYGAKIFVRFVAGILRKIIRAYSKENGKWIETTKIQERVITDESEIPPDILARVKDKERETDLTDELELKLAS